MMPDHMAPRLSTDAHQARELSVGFLLLNNFTLTPFATFIDAMRLAADEADLSRPIRCRWSTIASTRRSIKASCGIEISPEEPLGDPSRFDYVVVVGGLLHKGEPADEQTLAFLREAARKNVTVVGLCTATLTLIRAGIMSGHRCCVSWFHYQDLVREFPEITPIADQVFIVDRRRITCAGGAGALDVAAWIIEKQFGRAMAQKCLHILLVDQARPPTAGIGTCARPARAPRDPDDGADNGLARLDARACRPPQHHSETSGASVPGRSRPFAAGILPTAQTALWPLPTGDHRTAHQ